MKMMGGKSKCYNDDDDDGHEESIQEKVKLVQGDTAKKVSKPLRKLLQAAPCTTVHAGGKRRQCVGCRQTVCPLCCFRARASC